ncbi:hypothetical protein AB7714_28245 [Tardiphaga sp. 1201_B9_N1_1]|uniref:hypothetical protein n=1 Tax=unclassified Tardiphaga TaxID=2631404 RepID=UPI003F2665DC
MSDDPTDFSKFKLSRQRYDAFSDAEKYELFNTLIDQLELVAKRLDSSTDGLTSALHDVLARLETDRKADPKAAKTGWMVEVQLPSASGTPDLQVWAVARAASEEAVSAVRGNGMGYGPNDRITAKYQLSEDELKGLGLRNGEIRYWG